MRTCKRCGQEYASGSYSRHRLGHPEVPRAAYTPKVGYKAPRNAARVAEVLAGVAAGERGSAIAARMGISRERVRQIYTRETGLRLPAYGRLCLVCGDRYPLAGVEPAVAYDFHRQSERHGAVVEASERARYPRAVAKFWSRVDRRGPIPEYAPHLGRCWIWTGFPSPNGYGSAYGRIFGLHDNEWVHRIAYTITVGAIPAGLGLDHLCRVTLCVNPTHLEAVTPRENVLRSPIAVAAVNARKTRCKYGHPFTTENTRRTADGRGRSCRACESRRERQRTARKTAARRLAMAA